MKEKYIETLTKLLNEPIVDATSLKAWKSKIINVLTRIYGENSKQEEQIDQIQFRSYPMIYALGSRSDNMSSAGGGNNIAKCKELAYSLTKGFIEEINTFGLPENKESKEVNKGINILVNQSNTQDIKININVLLSALQDELSGKQLKEIQELIDSKDDQNSKKTKLFEKLKAFGIDVLSNVLANMLTNPQLWAK